MLNFTVGPVTSPTHILAMGNQPVPYFRTAEFSALMKQNETMLAELTKAPENARTAFLTGSGTLAMEMAVANLLTSADRVLVINGGTFGARFAALCDLWRVPHTDIMLNAGEALTARRLAPYENAGYTALLVNLHETSTGVLYDRRLLADFCRRNHLFFIADAISAFIADPIHMEEDGIDVLITSSQKALALAPGISMLVLSEAALDRVENHHASVGMYLDLADALTNMTRGQTPFTPAVGLLIQLHQRLSDLCRIGIEEAGEQIAALARDFRQKLAAAELPFALFSSAPSNAVTALRVEGTVSAHSIFERLEAEYGIWVCPNGGALRDLVFRVGHLGALTKEDNDTLINALADGKRKGWLN